MDSYMPVQVGSNAPHDDTRWTREHVALTYHIDTSESGEKSTREAITD
jgi:hypothetical protein